LRDEFINAGWKESKSDIDFDFSYKLGKFNKDKYNNVRTNQILSMFKGISITTKSGMCRQLKKYSIKQNKYIDK